MFREKDDSAVKPQTCGNCGHGKLKRRLRGEVQLLKCKPRSELVRGSDPCLFNPTRWKPKENNPANRLSKREKRRAQRKERKRKETQAKKGNRNHRKDQRRYTRFRDPRRC